jgi:hypothetical protein
LATESGTDRLVAGSCPDEALSDQRWIFHEWGSYTIRINEGAASPVWMTFIKE